MGTGDAGGGARSALRKAKTAGRKTLGAALIGVGGVVLLPSAIVLVWNLIIFGFLVKGTAGDYTPQYLWGFGSLVTGVIGLIIMGFGLMMWEGDVLAAVPPRPEAPAALPDGSTPMTPAMQQFMGRCIGAIKNEGIAAKGSARFCILLGDDERELPLDDFYTPGDDPPNPDAVVAEAQRMASRAPGQEEA